MSGIDDHVLGWTAQTEDVPLRQLVAVPVAWVGLGDGDGVRLHRRTIMPAVQFRLTRTGVPRTVSRPLISAFAAS